MSVSALKGKLADRMEVSAVLLALFLDPKSALDDKVTLVDAGVEDNSVLTAQVVDSHLEIVLCAFVGQIRGALILSSFTDAVVEDSLKFQQLFKTLLKAAKARLRPGDKIRLHLGQESEAGLYAIRAQSGDRVYAAFLSDLNVSEAPILCMLEEIKTETERIMDQQENMIVSEKSRDESSCLAEITTFLGQVVPRYDAICKSFPLDKSHDVE
jgi:hypothetical protein